VDANDAYSLDGKSISMKITGPIIIHNYPPSSSQTVSYLTMGEKGKAIYVNEMTADELFAFQVAGIAINRLARLLENRKNLT
jgi:hypothetical protein